MSKEKNTYQKEHIKKHTLGSVISSTERINGKGNIKTSLIETLIDLGVGVIGGGVAGSLIGKTSLLWGIGITGIGHYTNNKYLGALGIGMMAANGFQNKMATGVNGPELEGIEGMKERLENFKESFSEKLFLDKVLRKQAEPTATNGMGNVQYFTYPNEASGVGALGANDLDFSALDHINKQIEESGKRYGNQMKGVGATEDMNGADDLNGADEMSDLSLDPTSTNY